VASAAPLPPIHRQLKKAGIAAGLFGIAFGSIAFTWRRPA
jgi:hypothetical protein